LSSADEPTSPRGRSAIVAAFLSFLWPGLGQWYLGRRRDAVLYGAPVLALAVALAVQFTGGLTSAAARLFDPSFSLALLVVIGILGLWRLLAIADAGLQPRQLRTVRGRTGGVLAVLAALVLAMHGVAGYYTWSFYDASTKIFVGTTDGPEPVNSAPSGPTATDDYNVPPFATPATASSRITFLLTGIDKTTDRNHSLTDTLLIASIDPTTGRTAMVSFPRDLVGFPMYNGGTYDNKINSLMTYAANNPKAFPDGPLPTLVHELSYLLGIPIDYYAALDIDGFQTMIDAVGGVTVNVQTPINDPGYQWLDRPTLGFFLSAGTHHLDGRTALAFVRSRFSTSDFDRAARQQQLLVALEKKITNPDMIDKLPGLLQAASQTIRTNFPPDRLQEMLALADHVDTSMISRVVLQPPDYSFHPPDATTGGVYTLTLRWGAVKALSVQLFGSESAFYTASAAPSPSPGP
jgi:LCP family protein required for cell wall assembly